MATNVQQQIKKARRMRALLQQLEQRATMLDAAAAVGVHRATPYRWAKHNSAFRQQVKQVRQAYRESLQITQIEERKRRKEALRPARKQQAAHAPVQKQHKDTKP